MRYPDRFSWPEGVTAGVSLTFDDGRESQFTDCLPILDRHGIKASFYVPPHAMERNVAGWKALADSGHEIGNHSKSHPCSGNFSWADPGLEDLDLEWIENDILQAQTAIEEMIGVSCRTFAYPCGHTFVGRGENRRSYTPVIARHFIAGRSFFNEPVNDPSYCDLPILNGTEGDMLSVEQLQAILRQAHDEQAWILLACHDVGREVRRQMLHADTLDWLCAHAADAANGVWLDTAEHIADYIRESRLV